MVCVEEKGVEVFQASVAQMEQSHEQVLCHKCHHHVHVQSRVQGHTSAAFMSMFPHLEKCLKNIGSECITNASLQCLLTQRTL